MPFKIKNLAHTRRDPNKRGHSNPTIRRGAARMRIGQRRIRIGKSIIISDSTYAAHKSMIDTYIDQNLISLLAIGEAAAEVLEAVQPQLHAPSPMPPVPSPFEDGSSAESGVVEISTDDPDESGEGAVILEMAPEEAEAEEPIIAEPEKAMSSKKAVTKEEPAKESAKRTSRRRKKKDN